MNVSGMVKMISLGESKIKEIFQKEGILFKMEYSFPDLISFKKQPLRFDFAVFENGKLKCLVEYDGEHHFRYIEHFSKSKQKWQYQREMDVRKNSYCLIHNIPLYRIPFTEYDNLIDCSDIFNDRFLVKDKWWGYTHNPFKN